VHQQLPASASRSDPHVLDGHYDKVMDVDLRGVFHGLKHGIRHMLNFGGGSIVNWSSTGGITEPRNTSAYTAAKHGVVG
jgi:NAD(P)-dependent dehydrogenase (short-subunit alcohol dehydrogenase family)